MSSVRQIWRRLVTAWPWRTEFAHVCTYDDIEEAGDDNNDPCSWCGGEWYLQECDDPIQCCDSRCDGQWHPCSACQGTGLAKHQVIW